MLDEINPVSVSDILPEFGDHMRLPTGFADDADRLASLEPYLRAGITAVEAYVGRALKAREFSWAAYGYAGAGDHLVLPIAPVRQVIAVEIIDRDDVASTVDPGSYVLLPDIHKPVLKGLGTAGLPSIPEGGAVRVMFEAGYGTDWSDVPVALRQAVMIMAAHFEAQRGGVGGKEKMPSSALSLMTPYRQVRL